MEAMELLQSERETVKIITKLARRDDLTLKQQRMVSKLLSQKKLPMRLVIAKVPGATDVARAHLLGVARSQVVRWKAGNTRPSEPMARKLSRLTGFDVDEIRGI